MTGSRASKPINAKFSACLVPAKAGIQKETKMAQEKMDAGTFLTLLNSFSAAAQRMGLRQPSMIDAPLGFSADDGVAIRNAQLNALNTFDRKRSGFATFETAPIAVAGAAQDAMNASQKQWLRTYFEWLKGQ